MRTPLQIQRILRTNVLSRESYNPCGVLALYQGTTFSRAVTTERELGFRVCVRTVNLHAVPQERLKDSVMSAVPPELFVLSDSTAGLRPTSANLFGMLFFKTPTKSSS